MTLGKHYDVFDYYDLRKTTLTSLDVSLLSYRR